MRKALFLDCDGTLVVDPGPDKRDALPPLVPYVVDTLRDAVGLGYSLFIVSNQACVGRGVVTEQQAWSYLRSVADAYSSHGAHITSVAMCPHRADMLCGCRKPRPGMLHHLGSAWDIDFSKSWVIGDKEADYELALRVPGLRSKRVETNIPWVIPRGMRLP
jgi:D-glycero-D-manno-heptose 1,7-bisphosphate phosphatase